MPPPSTADELPAGVERLLRPACQLALQVAADGEAASPRVPAPPSLVPLLRHGRLSAASYAKVRAAVDADGVFRARVAESATEDGVGRAGWLWLHRPVDWAEDPAFSIEVTPPPSRSTKAERDGAARLRQKLAEAEAARREATTAAAAARKEAAALRTEVDRLTAEVDALTEQRREALRTAKANEADLARARADLATRRQAMIDLEQELAAARASAGERDRSDPDRAPEVAEPRGAVPSAPVEPAFDRAAVEAAVSAASQAAGDLAAALATAAAALAPDAGEGSGPAAPPTPPAPPPKRAGGSRRRSRPSRPLPALPPGVFDGSPEADRWVLGQAANLVVVDGYNLARAAWSDLDPEEERTRTIRLLEAVQARSGATTIVVFDGQDGTTAPRASRHVGVRFSGTGQTADDAIAELVEATASTQPIVVVSSDRAVQRHARQHGAMAVSSAGLLAVAR